MSNVDTMHVVKDSDSEPVTVSERVDGGQLVGGSVASE